MKLVTINNSLLLKYHEDPEVSQPLHQRINILRYHLVHRQDPKTVMVYIT